MITATPPTTELCYQLSEMQWFFAFFLVSGYCSLVYETVWLRLAMAEFGVTTPSVSIVLSVFMAGLALGSWGAGRLLRRAADRPGSFALRLYALAELTIAVSGVAVPHELRLGRRLLEGIAAGMDSSSYYVLCGAWVMLALLPWCTAMGATFPLALEAIRKAVAPRARRPFSYLYLANVLGAMLGTLLPAFVLIELSGFARTLRVTSALNLLLAGSAFAVSGRLGRRAPAPAPAQIELAPARRRGMLWLLFATGLSSMAMEVIWIRQFTIYLGPVVYTFATILAVYLLATFLGSTAYRAAVRLLRASPLPPSTPLAVVGLLGLLPLWAADERFRLPGTPWGAAARVVIAILPFSAALGALTPMLVDVWSGGDADRAGAAYAVNVLGCILGPLLAGFVLLPWLGERWALALLAAPFLFVGAFFSLGAARGPQPWLERAFVAAVAANALVLVGATTTYEDRFQKALVRRDHTATVIATGEGMGKSLLINGVGTTHLTPITKMMAHLPLAHLSAPPQNALVICFGMGTTFRSLLSWGIPTTAVELVPSVPALFSYYHADGNRLLASPEARLVIDDGRRYLERAGETYDAIVIDPPPPVEAAGSSLLYSREFYELAKKHLKPGGILQQWFPGGEPSVLSSLARALKDSFPVVRVFISMEGWGFHFLASDAPIAPLRGADLAARMPPAAQTDLLEWGPNRRPDLQLDAVVMREVPIGRVIAAAAGVPALNDDRPVNEYYALRRRFKLAW